MQQLTYPGVYVQPIFAEQPPLEGVATSITAFIGRAPRGRVCDPKTINSMGDYERSFDGLSLDSTISYMVSDFYNNGGSQGVIVRLFEPYYPTVAAYNEAVSAAEKCADQANSLMSANPKIADLQSKLDSWYKKQTFPAGIEANAAKAFMTYFDNFADKNPTLDASKDPGKTEIPAAIAQGVKVAAPYGKATFDINEVNTAVSAANTVAQSALMASLGSSDSAPTVLSAAQSTAAGYVNDPAKTAASTVVALAGTTYSGASKNIGGGTIAAYQALYSIPSAIDGACGITKKLTDLSTDSNVSADQQKDYADAVKKINADGKLVVAMQQAALQGSNAAAVVAAINGASSSIVDAAKAAQAEGDSGLDVANAGTQAYTAEMIAYWPDTFKLEADNEGSWGNQVTVTTNTTGITSSVVDAINQQNNTTLKKSDLFNMTVVYITPTGSQISESYNNVTVSSGGGPQRLDRILSHQSNLVQVPLDSSGNPVLPANPPDPNSMGQGQNGTDSQFLTLDSYLGDQASSTGIYALDKTDSFNILCIPPDERSATQPAFENTPNYVYQTAAEYCFTRRAMLLIDPPTDWTQDYKSGNISNIELGQLGSFSADAGRSAAVYFPRLLAVDPNLNGQTVSFPACGSIAGQWATNDQQVGPWKAPAGLNAAINGIVGPEVVMNDTDNGMLNPQGINCIRYFQTGGSVIWGGLTMRGNPLLADQYQFIPVMRMLLYIESSLLQDTKWAVFQPNDEALWSQLRLQIGDFMAGLFKQGAFGGTTAAESYFVKCDASTTTPEDQRQGIVNVQVGFLPVYPAEFVVITVQQMTATSS